MRGFLDMGWEEEKRDEEEKKEEREKTIKKNEKIKEVTNEK